jgi:hypothetical protein
MGLQPNKYANVSAQRWPYYIVNLQAGWAINPGQPLTVSWSFRSSISIRTGQLTASFFVLHPLNGKVLINNPSLISVSGGYAIAGEELSVSESLELVPLDDVIGSSMYDFNASNGSGRLSVQLNLQLQGLDADNNSVNMTFTRTEGYLACHDVDVDMWSWTPLAAAEWKADYQVVGTLTNRCQFASITPTRLELIEVDATDGTMRTLQVGIPGAVEAGNSVTIVAADVTQGWLWIDPTNSYINAPISKQFIYTTDFAFRDQYGNNYPTLAEGIPFYVSTNLNVTVSVSALKLVHAGNAAYDYQFSMASIVAAAGFAIASAIASEVWLVAVGLAAASAAAGATGAIFGAMASGENNLANDPIQPDFHTQVFATVSPAKLPAIVERDDTYPNVKRYLAMISSIHSAENAIYSTLPRILGSSLVKDRTAFKKQLEVCQSAISGIQSNCSELSGVAKLAGNEFDSKLIPYEDRINEAMEKLKSAGIGASTRSLLVEGGLPTNLLAEADAAVANEMLPSIFIELGGVETTVLSIALIKVAAGQIEAAKAVVQMASAFLDQF